MIAAALDGCGLAYVWEDRVETYLCEGRLRRSLSEWCPADDTLFLFYPSRRHVSAGLRAVIDALRIK